MHINHKYKLTNIKYSKNEKGEIIGQEEEWKCIECNKTNTKKIGKFNPKKITNQGM